MRLRRFWTRVRDALTGRFVKREEAETRPAFTVVERVEDDEAKR